MDGDGAGEDTVRDEDGLGDMDGEADGTVDGDGEAMIEARGRVFDTRLDKG